MSKIGVKLSINVKDIDKALLNAHTNGKTYLNMTAFIDPNNPGQYGDHGMITQDMPKERRDAGKRSPILGNVKVFWKEDQQQQHSDGMQQANQAMDDGLDDDTPF